MQDIIILKNLTKLYKNKAISSEKYALNEVNLNIAKGCIFGLLGPNGAGKSTLINILAGTIIKTSGFVSIDGSDIDITPKLAKSKIGIVPQEIALDSFFPISQALEFAAGYYGIKPHQRKTEEILKALGLYDKRDALPRQLSGGMKRRFLIAKALVHSPKIVVLDEPTAGVDLELREQLWEYVKKLNSQGTTIILTTHYLTEAEELCNYIAFINHGRIIKEDSKENLLSALSCRYVDVEFDSPVLDKNLHLANKFQILTEAKIRFHFNTKDQDFNKLLADIQSTELNIKNLKVSQADLESVFKKLIQ